LLNWCEQERLLRAQVMVGGERGYDAEDIRRLARIRSLRKDLGLEREAVLIVLHMREQMIDLLQEINDLEKLMMSREEDLIREIQRLRRRLAEEARW
jgi:DNA-binding transcriptional MerR regulator